MKKSKKTIDYTSPKEFYDVLGMEDPNVITLNAIMNRLPSWLTGPIGCALLGLAFIIFQNRKIIGAFFKGGRKAVKKLLRGKHKKKRDKNYYNW